MGSIIHLSFSLNYTNIGRIELLIKKRVCVILYITDSHKLGNTNTSKKIKTFTVRQDNLTSLVCLLSAASVCAPRSLFGPYDKQNHSRFSKQLFNWIALLFTELC